jgi:hypothetical protein
VRLTRRHHHAWSTLFRGHHAFSRSCARAHAVQFVDGALPLFVRGRLALALATPQRCLLSWQR